MHVQQAVGEVRFYACNVDPTLTISKSTLDPGRNASGGEGVQVGQSETAEESTEVPFAQEVPIASLFAGVRLKGTDRDLATVDNQVDIIPACGSK